MKNYYFFIDDNIWVFRDLSRKRPKSLFDNAYLGMLKDKHDKYGMKVQLNVFYRTDFFYGNDEFELSQMTDCYKGEWQANSYWLKLAFHAKQEFPDYPYVNASYDDVKNNFETVKNEIFRFAGGETFSYVTNPHWLPMSYDGCRALAECGVKILGCSNGTLFPDDTDISVLPYGHKGRLLQNRQKESGIFTRVTEDKAVSVSLKSYNHISQEAAEKTCGTNKFFADEKTGLKFKRLCDSICINLCSKETIENSLSKFIGREFMGIGLHEQYFYSDYYAYQPDYAEKIDTAISFLDRNEYKPIFMEELSD